MATEFDHVKREVAIAHRVLAELGLATGIQASFGHASMRLPSDPGKFVVKGRGYGMDALAEMTPEDMITVDLDGNMLGGPSGTSQCYEVKMHSCIYRSRSDVQSVVHLHPQFSIVMSVIGATLHPMCNQGLQLVRDPLPIFPHCRLILSEEDGTAVAQLLGNSRAIILQGHGAATVGNSLGDALVTMLQLEEQAKLNWYAYCAAGPNHGYIPDEQIDVHDSAMEKMNELPHLKGPLQRSRRAGRGDALWAYYSDVVTRKWERNEKGRKPRNHR